MNNVNQESNPKKCAFKGVFRALSVCLFQLFSSLSVSLLLTKRRQRERERERERDFSGTNKFLLQVYLPVNKDIRPKFVHRHIISNFFEVSKMNFSCK